MKLSKVRAILLKRLAYLEVYLSGRGRSLSFSTQCCIADEIAALRMVLNQVGMLDEDRLSELREKERGRLPFRQPEGGAS